MAMVSICTTSSWNSLARLFSFEVLSIELSLRIVNILFNPKAPNNTPRMKTSGVLFSGHLSLVGCASIRTTSRPSGQSNRNSIRDIERLQFVWFVRSLVRLTKRPTWYQPRSHSRSTRWRCWPSLSNLKQCPLYRQWYTNPECDPLKWRAGELDLNAGDIYLLALIWIARLYVQVLRPCSSRTGPATFCVSAPVFRGRSVARQLKWSISRSAACKSACPRSYCLVYNSSRFNI